jgi:dTDP-4-amino-4,6-dideoxygalactose transaminase
MLKSTIPMNTASSIDKRQAIPSLDLSRQYESIREEVTQAIEAVCASQQFVMGKAVADFEKSAAAYLGCAESIGCASGTDAIWLALAAVGIGPGDDVITSPFSFFATASAITRLRARPVFVDVDPGTLNICAQAVESRIENSHSQRVKAILPVHLYGQCADMDALQAVAKTYRLKIVEDAAQAFGASWRGVRAGALGEAAAFSFYPSKNLSCFGDGGLVSTNSAEAAERVRLLRNHGSRRRYYHEEIGWNSRLDSIQAAVLSVKLKYIDQWNAKRSERASAYELLLKSAGLLSDQDSGAPAPVTLLNTSPHATHIYHQYVVRVQRREALRDFLSQRKIGSEIYYPVPLHMQQCFLYLGYTAGSLPETEKAAEEVLALPMYPELTAPEQAAVVNAIAEFYS